MDLSQIGIAIYLWLFLNPQILIIILFILSIIYFLMILFKQNKVKVEVT